MGKKIKKTMPGFANSMSGGELDVLKKIVKHHYKEFIGVFRMLEKSVDHIHSLEYDDTEEKRLFIKVTADERDDAQDICNAAQDFIEDNLDKYNATVVCMHKTVEIELETI